LTKLAFAVMALTTVHATLNAANVTLPLWPNGAPGPRANSEAEKDSTTEKDNKPGGRPVIRLTNISAPSLTVYKPASGDTGAAVVVFPGGSYRILAWDLEGTEICEWLNSIGATAVLVKYRVPEPADIPRYQEPLQDAQRALGLVREHATEWHIDPAKIGVLGFSAGGHLSVMVSNTFEKRTYEPVDEADQKDCRPDFAVLIYPAYLTTQDLQKLAPEVQVTAKTPPSFIVQTEDDPVHVEGSLLYYRALKDAKVQAEMHLFSTGGHGYGMRQTKDAVTGWPKLAEAWMRSRGILSGQ
jgi:acetyl esterase/lipase